MATEENGLLRDMHSNIQVLLFEVKEVREQVAKQNGHIDELLAWKIKVTTAIATLGAVTTGSFAVAGLAIAIAAGVL